MQAFSAFIGGTTATPNQIEFINLVVEELTQNGVMEPGRLFESPYPDINAQGPLGVFLPATVTQIVQVLEGIRERAVAREFKWCNYATAQSAMGSTALRFESCLCLGNMHYDKTCSWCCASFVASCVGGNCRPVRPTERQH